MREIIKSTKLVLKIVAVWVLLSAGSLVYELSSSSYSSALHAGPDTLVIVYRPGCGRCRRTLPKFYVRNIFQWPFKKKVILNADKLSGKQLEKLDVRITPVFKLGGKTYNTDNLSRMYSLWDKTGSRFSLKKAGTDNDTDR